MLVSFFWDKIHGGAIKSESVAVMICDWLWTSGAWGLKNTQKVLGVVQDGIVGVKTLGAINELYVLIDAGEVPVNILSNEGKKIVIRTLAEMQNCIDMIGNIIGKR